MQFREALSPPRPYRVSENFAFRRSWETQTTGCSLERTSKVESVSDAQVQMRVWSLSKLSEEDLAFVKQFKSIITLSLGDRSLVCFHGSPTSFDDLIWPTTPEEEFVRLMNGYGDSRLCGGHKHLQYLRRLKDTFFFNPGSVGFSYDHSQTGEEPRADSWAEYAIISADERGSGVEFRRVPFDTKDWIMATARSGRPDADRVAGAYSTTI